MNIKPIIYIPAKRCNTPTYLSEWKGQMYDAPMSYWSKLTGKTTACMCARRKKRSEDPENYTIGQMLGTEPHPYDTETRQKKLSDFYTKVKPAPVSLTELHKSKSDVRSQLTRNGLSLANFKKRKELLDSRHTTA